MLVLVTFPHSRCKHLGWHNEIETINYTINAAYRIDEQWSIGGGIDIIQGSGKLRRDAFNNLMLMPLI